MSAHLQIAFDAHKPAGKDFPLQLFRALGGHGKIERRPAALGRDARDVRVGGADIVVAVDAGEHQRRNVLSREHETVCFLVILDGIILRHERGPRDDALVRYLRPFKRFQIRMGMDIDDLLGQEIPQLVFVNFPVIRGNGKQRIVYTSFIIFFCCVAKGSFTTLSSESA